MNPLLPAQAQQNLVLASQSPRRYDILSGLNIDFTVVPAADHVEAEVTEADPFKRPLECARVKALDVAQSHRDATVIGADTVVILDNDVLEKPRDDEQAAEFLRRLSGHTHTVVTGVAVLRLARDVELVESEATRVTFRELSASEIDGYVASGEGRDKAGSYAVQGLGAGLVSAVDGCFYNVVGLPVARLFDMLKRTYG